MTSEPRSVHRAEALCSDCGLPSVVTIEERPMCGHCFHLGLSAASSRRLHRRTPLPPGGADPSIESTVRTALDEFGLLRRRIESVLRQLETK